MTTSKQKLYYKAQADAMASNDDTCSYSVEEWLGDVRLRRFTAVMFRKQLAAVRDRYVSVERFIERWSEASSYQVPKDGESVVVDLNNTEV